MFPLTQAPNPEQAGTSTDALGELANQRRINLMMSAFTCKTCAMDCRYFMRIECEKRGYDLWEPADRTSCVSCPSWHAVKQCCYRYGEPCRLLVEERKNLAGNQTARV